MALKFKYGDLMPTYNFSNNLKQDFKPYSEMHIADSVFKAIDDIFSRHQKRLTSNSIRDGDISATAYELKDAIESELNIDLTGNYFGRDLAHPIMLAPGKHSRVGPKDEPLRIVKFRVAEGFSGIILKTAIANDQKGTCSMIKNRGDAYSPSFKRVSRDMFLSGERGAKLDIRGYCENFLQPLLSQFNHGEVVIVPSILSGLPLKENEGEWRNSFNHLLQKTHTTEIDFSPTAFQSIRELEQEIGEIFRWLEKRYPDKIGILKIPGHFRNIMGTWIRAVRDKNNFKGIQRYVLFNREIFKLLIPWNLARVTTSIGGDAIFYSNMKVLQQLWESEPHGMIDNVSISYSGGVNNGIKAATAIGLSNAGSVQIATELINEGGLKALHRVLGGLAVYLHWIGNYLDKKVGIDVYSINALKELFYRTEIKDITKGYIGEPQKTYAYVDPDICDGNCYVKNPARDNNFCPASIVCPSYAFRYPVEGTAQTINNNLCIGCENCRENCIRNAITMKKWT